ncbi:TonB-dependent receptor [Sphingomicrobium astaxanthinifaciens]|uniref:TonB-dependent receptor n=1 Tax=Sphingomicrobium astaxanthinifaciens TaxID=1227949 RepID=UPI001FCC0F91|nr:TonB-dependent receptor [Sphingomicrobium astaxanthinifaciens]MCJ7422287.1 TonB-dependent receptor [Sphingomicrobium astaxanthinifaciens]
MKNWIRATSRTTLLIAASSLPYVAHAQDAQPAATDEEQDTLVRDEAIIVTATRREGTVQDVPINISAVGGAELAERRLDDLREIARAVPGVYIVDQGNRSGTPIVFRGLNATGLGSFDGNANGGGTVATYVGEVPLYVDLRLKDMERVEFLIGPQGTLYGAGTLGGAIRYIPAKPRFEEISGQVRADAYDYAHGDGLSTDFGATINIPLAPTLAFRASLDKLDDTGFIDYPFAVQEVGLSNPDVDPADAAAYAANLRRLDDVNYADILTARAALRFAPGDLLDVTASYHFQEDKTGGRQFSQTRLSSFPVPIGKYEAALRVPEPNTRTTQLASLEAELDLGFGKLVSATGYSVAEEEGNRDQTDLLIGLQYSYEAFPEFTAFTLEEGEQKTFTQEVRFVSDWDSRFSLIAGAFYLDQEIDNLSTEFTPGFDQFAVDEFGGIQLRPDSIEYLEPFLSELTEQALYGELSYQLTDDWQVTVGGRYYDYELVTQQTFDLPLFRTVFEGDAPDSIVLDFETGGQEDDGFLFKFNTSYDVAANALVYATVSQGFRIGNSNAIAPCPVPLPPNQIICAQPGELDYRADKTTNYELGFKTQWLGRTLTLNGAVYYIDWSDPQIDSATTNGQAPITINGAGAKSQGLELSTAWRVNDKLSLTANYSYNDAQLTELSPNIIPVIFPPGFDNSFIDGQKGDRLPGSPRHQGGFAVDYDTPLTADWDLALSYAVYAQSDVLTRTGARGAALTLPGFDLHQASVGFENRHGTRVIVYADNLWGEFAETGVRATPDWDQVVTDINGDPVYARSFGTFVAPPRRIGVRVSQEF